MTTIKIAPSILSADFTRLGDEVCEVLACGADYIHVDVMDGVFVPNITIGIPVLKSLRARFPEAVFDVHLMITEPVRYVESFVAAGADIVSVHLEADTPENISRAIEKIRACGATPALAIRPATPAEAVEPWLSDIGLLVVMTVEPGFGGQKFMEDQLPKIRVLRARLDAVNPACDLEADGGISPATAPFALEAGTNVLVAGSAVFGAVDRAEVINKLRSK